MGARRRRWWAQGRSGSQLCRCRCTARSQPCRRPAAASCATSRRGQRTRPLSARPAGSKRCGSTRELIHFRQPDRVTPTPWRPTRVSTQLMTVLRLHKGSAAISGAACGAVSNLATLPQYQVGTELSGICVRVGVGRYSVRCGHADAGNSAPKRRRHSGRPAPSLWC